MTTQKIITISFLWCIAIAIIILIKTNIINKNQPILPQEYMQNIAMTKFDENGRMQQILSARSWEYFQNKQESILNKPQLIVYKENGTTWKLQSEVGTTQQESLASAIDYITLTNNVIMQRLKTKNITPVKFTTSKALYYPEQEFITSTKQVTMEKPGILVTGVGLKSYMNNKHAQLLSNVKTIYVRNKS